jgi:SAM-dependent methyltransferase
MSDKHIWEHFGEHSPYYSVATLRQFREENLNEEHLDEFFRSGEEYVEVIWKEIETNFGAGFKPGRALDFGCGVGRLTLPLARKCGRITGVDVSSTMILEAEKNAAAKKAENVEFRKVEEDLADLAGEYDLVHSFIVIQHIAPRIGYPIFEKLVAALNPGGIGVLQVTYDNPFPLIRQYTRNLYQRFPTAYRLRNLILRKEAEPLLPMYLYDLNRLFGILHRHGCHKSTVLFTDHGFRGVIIIFQKTGERLL